METTHPRRRLSDKIIDAHEVACQKGRMEVADVLLQALELELSAIGGRHVDNRSDMAALEEAYARHQAAKQALGQ